MKPSMRTRTLTLAALTAPTFALVGAPTVAEAAPPRCHGKPATIVGTPGADRLEGTPKRDVIVARGGDDTVIARGGRDLVCGGSGSDELVGGFGNDRLYGQGDKRWTDRLGSVILTGDVLRGGLGDDFLHPGPRMRKAGIYEQDLVVFADSRRRVRVDLSNGPTSKRATAVGQGRDRIVWHDRLGVVGSPKDDRLVGSDKRDYLVGVWGDDRLEGRGGRDQIYPDRAEFAPGDAWPGGGGNDLVLGGTGQDEVNSTGGRDEIRSGGGDDVISVKNGRGDRAYGESGDDLFFVYFSGSGRNLRGAVLDGGEPTQPVSDTVYLNGRGSDRGTVVAVDAAAGRVSVESDGSTHAGRLLDFETVGLDGPVRWDYRGSDGPDDVLVDDGKLHFRGHGGRDMAQGGPDRNVMFGGDGNDHLFGGRRDDRITGGPGNDSLAGRAGDDRLVGSAGFDRLRGNQGRDTCEGERVFGCER